MPQRVHPQWSWLQCRYASVMSYRLAQIFLRDAFPGGSQLPSSSIKVNVREIGNRLEQEARRATMVTKVATSERRGLTERDVEVARVLRPLGKARRCQCNKHAWHQNC